MTFLRPTAHPSIGPELSEAQPEASKSFERGCRYTEEIHKTSGKYGLGSGGNFTSTRFTSATTVHHWLSISHEDNGAVITHAQGEPKPKPSLFGPKLSDSWAMCDISAVDPGRFIVYTQG